MGYCPFETLLDIRNRHNKICVGVVAQVAQQVVALNLRSDCGGDGIGRGDRQVCRQIATLDSRRRWRAVIIIPSDCGSRVTPTERCTASSLFVVVHVCNAGYNTR
jgi:hypothetical protein